MRVCVIGLGNPGPRYQHTRHNVGFDWIDAAIRQLKFSAKNFSEKFQSHWMVESLGELEIHFLKPQTYMNESGKALSEWMQKYQSDSRVLIVYDEIDIPLGKIRYRPDGSDGGHRGLRSIIEHAQTQEVPRLRLGVGRPAGEDTRDYVLDKFTPTEKDVLEKVLGSAGDQLKIWCEAKNEEDAMNQLNGAKFKYVS